MMSVILVISMIVFSKPLVMFNLKDPITNSLAVSLLFVFALKVSMRLFTL